MGTLNFTVTKYAPSRGSGAATLTSTDISTSDAFTTTTSAAFVEDGSGDITASVGQVFYCVADEAMWIRFGGDAATVGDGFYLVSGVPYWLEVATSGKVSVIDVS